MPPLNPEHIKDIPDMKRFIEATETEKAKTIIVVEQVEYLPDSFIIKPILRRSTGTVSLMSVDSGEGVIENTSRFDTYVQVMDGQADIVLKGKGHLLQVGQGIIIPAHARYQLKFNRRFKLLMTVIKSGYE